MTHEFKNPLSTAPGDTGKLHDSGMTLLMSAIRRGDIVAMEGLIRDIAALDELIRSGVVTRTNKYGATMLIFAASRHRSEISIDVINKLIRSGVDVNQTDNTGRTALMYVRTQAAATALIGAGANVDMVDDNGETALMYAQKFQVGYVEQMILLKQALEIKDTQNTIKYIKILFEVDTSALSILFSSLEELSSILNRLAPQDYDALLHTALRCVLMLPYQSNGDLSEIEQLSMAIRKHDSTVNKDLIVQP